MNRVVTGYDDNGDPAVIVQGEPPTVIHAGRYTTTELWVADRGPLHATGSDASAREWALEPPPGGSCFRIVEIAAGGAVEDEIAPRDADQGAPASASASDTAHSEFQGAHATDTLDYVTILRGEVTLVIGGTEMVLRPGDSVVQQPGVPHDWQNRSRESAVMVGVLLSAR
jgi:mannose-6-phosphate isomerase-like protein (cupin superfamily)